MQAPAPRALRDGGPPVIQATTQELGQRARALCTDGKRKMLGITGAPGAGKSTVCAGLLAMLGDSAQIIGMDGFHFANHELERLGRATRKGAPDTFDVDGYAALLGRLRIRHAEPIYGPVFNRGIEESIGSAVAVRPETLLVITEGNYLLLEDHGWAAVREHLDQVWFLDVDKSVRAERLVRRRQQFGHTQAEAEDWVTSVDQRNASVVDATRQRADLVVELVAAPDSITLSTTVPEGPASEPV